MEALDSIARQYFINDCVCSEKYEQQLSLA